MTTAAVAPPTDQLPASAPERARDQRARLQVVPDRVPAPKLPFVVLVSMILVGGVVGLLVFNTSMQQSAFQEQKLQAEATGLAAHEEALDGQLQKMEDPHAIASRAQRLGMVIPQTPAMLRVTDGKLQGEATPADRSATPPLHEKVVKPYSVRMAEKRAAELLAAQQAAAQKAAQQKAAAKKAAEKKAAEARKSTDAAQAD